MKIIVTGAAGFIGRHVMSLAGSLGHVPFGVDWSEENVNRSISEDGYIIILSSFDDIKILDQVSSGFFDAVIHLAATARVPVSIDHPVETHINNVERTLRLLDACRVSNTRFVFAGSSSVYGNGASFPTCELSSPQPLTPYGLQKSIIDQYIRVYNGLYGTDAVSLRFFNVFGPGQYPGGSYPMAVSAWSWAVAHGGRAELYGDGSIRRDYTYVGDVSRAILAAAMREVPFTGQSINICAGSPVGMLEVWDAIIGASKTSAVLHRMPPRAGDPKITWGDNSLALKELGWKPRVLFHEGVEKTLEWVSSKAKLSLSE
jgi:UDP-glucose 4-epimerase